MVTTVIKVLKLVASIARLLASQISAAFPTGKVKISGPGVVQYHTDSNSEASTAHASGKSIKQLMKDAKKAEALAMGNEHVPDSKYFVNSLKGHGGPVVSISLSADDKQIMTACDDQVCGSIITLRQAVRTIKYPCIHNS